jgi:hypothetical protein
MQWAQITWIFLHTFPEKIKEEFFKKNIKDCLGLIKYIVSYLPCPICTKHANEYFHKYNIYLCKTKEDLKIYLWKFHNEVNYRLKKKQYKLINLDMYKKINFKKVTKLFIKEYQRPYYYTKVMNGWLRKEHAKKIIFYMSVNQKQFD